jgi:GDPmannose 4,6-dehydratase/GDP-4-dehydro-6-deoxy-D-mannose reductase
MKIKKILITGISGSGGSYLAEFIHENFSQIKIHGISRWHSTTGHQNLNTIKKNVNIHDVDLNDLGSTLNVIKTLKPDAIFHLASHANVRSSFDNPNAVISNNIFCTLNLLEAVKISKINPIIQICSTSEVYGRVKKDQVPINEKCPLNPASPYAVSKVTQDLLGKTYFMNYDLRIITTRMFSYLNPRRQDLFATSFAKQIALIEKGRLKYLTHGNLNSIRTLIDVRDAMKAYWFAISKGKIGETYNIGGDTTLKVGDCLEMLKSLSNVKILSKLNPELLRPTDVTLQIPDTRKFKKHTGWRSKYTFEQSLNMLLEFWRKRV